MSFPASEKNDEHNLVSKQLCMGSIPTVGMFNSWAWFHTARKSLFSRPTFLHPGCHLKEGFFSFQTKSFGRNSVNKIMGRLGCCRRSWTSNRFIACLISGKPCNSPTNKVLTEEGSFSITVCNGSSGWGVAAAACSSCFIFEPSCGQTWFFCRSISCTTSEFS